MKLYSVVENAIELEGEVLLHEELHLTFKEALDVVTASAEAFEDSLEFLDDDVALTQPNKRKSFNGTCNIWELFIVTVPGLSGLDDSKRETLVEYTITEHEV